MSKVLKLLLCINAFPRNFREIQTTKKQLSLKIVNLDQFCKEAI